MENLISKFIGTVKHWYIPFIIGILFIGVGIYTFYVPVEAYLVLSIIFSVSFFISGIFDAVFAWQNQKTLPNWGWIFVFGIFTWMIGMYLWIYPKISMEVLPYYVGFVLMFRSFQLLGFALDIKAYAPNKWLGLFIWSIVGIFISFLLLANPIIAGLSLVALTGTSFIILGFASCSLAFNLKSLKNNLDEKISPEMREKIQSLENEFQEIVRKK
uniref:HdeD family acid-resistance protein n=1 Tax=Ornithobacterium rhinotracheale TaxID=28251 RepID=UPI0039A53DA1